MPRTFSRNGPRRGERGGGLFEARGEEKKGKRKKRRRGRQRPEDNRAICIRTHTGRPQPLRVSCEDDRARNLIEGSLFPFVSPRNVSSRTDFVTVNFFRRVNSLGNDLGCKFRKSVGGIGFVLDSFFLSFRKGDGRGGFFLSFYFLKG